MTDQEGWITCLVSVYIYVVTNSSTPLGGVEGTGTPWNALERSSPQDLQGSKAYKYSVPAYYRFCSREYKVVYRQSIIIIYYFVFHSLYYNDIYLYILFFKALIYLLFWGFLISPHIITGLKSGVVRWLVSQVTHFVYLTLVFRPQSKPAFYSLSFRPDLATL